VGSDDIDRRMILHPVSYKRHRFLPEIIAHAVWLYFRFPLSLRLVEEMLFERGIVVSYETIRRWAIKFGADYARRLKRKAPTRHDVWHLDEVVISINGEKRYLWRAVDQEGYVLDEIVQIHRNTKAAQRLLTRLLRKQGRPPKRIVTDKLASYGTARRKIMPKVEHRSHKGLNNRAGEFPCSHPETRMDDAGVSILAWIAAVRLDLLRRPKPFRPPSHSTLFPLNPPSSPEGDAEWKSVTAAA
jgi:putative transposase